MKRSHPLALRPNQMVFPSLHSELPACFPLNALNTPTAYTFISFIYMMSVLTAIPEPRMIAYVLHFWVTRCFFIWVLTSKLPIKTVAFGRSKSFLPQNKEKEGEEGANDEIEKNQASDQNLDCWKNNIYKLFFPPEIRERKATIVFETASCKNCGIHANKIKQRYSCFI